ncbi:MAG: diguanylate cyclase [Acidobacteria bacterium]|nr:diguanylate cyclase [Acidobacteriota bacterium]MCA1641484.1 diguanylate cyclase [Acidobacteriota bacterium]
MLKGNLKSLALLCGVTALAASLLVLSLGGFLALTSYGLILCAALLCLTAAVSRFTVPISSGDGKNYKSVADTFIFLTAMMFGIGPAALLAGVDGFLSTRRVTDKRLRVYLTAAAVFSTGVAVFVYQLIAQLSAGTLANDGEHFAPLGAVLLPLCGLALVQYGLNTFACVGYVALESGERMKFSREGIVWTSMAQVAGAASAALFYSGISGGGLSFVLIGTLIAGLVYLLYRFDEKRVLEMSRAEEEKLKHIREIADLHMNTIESLAIAIDAKDQTTHGHVRRTQIYAMELGKILGVREHELHALEAGALLHDVGKLAVPEYILNKPGKLTAAEFDKMKIHTVVGGDIIKRVNFPYPVEDIVRFHHEKWDGSGYPKGLKGEMIPLVARIISVVDFYDATRCDRPYRVGMKREDSLALLRRMAGSSFDPHVVDTFVGNIDFFDNLIADQDIQEQVASEDNPGIAGARPDAGLASDVLGSGDDSGYRSIVEAQREVFALHEIAQTIGSSLNMQDTVTLVSNKLRAIVPFDTCVIYLVDERSGKALAAHAAGEHAETFARRRVTIGEGITGWVIANARSMCNTPPELDLVGVPEEVCDKIKGVLISPLIRENGAFGAITLYSQTRASYTTEHVRLLESVSQHASVALNNALTFEKTKESALIDPLTELPNARAFHLSLEQRLAECQRLNREPVSVLCMDLDDFKKVNDAHGHGIGDRLLANVAGVIKKQLRQMDVLARYAGDEFVAIMPMASNEVAEMVAERIRSAVEAEQFPVRAGKTARIGISVGIACFPSDGETAEELLSSAGSNMQRQKHAGKLAPEDFSSSITSIESFR